MVADCTIIGQTAFPIKPFTRWTAYSQPLTSGVIRSGQESQRSAGASSAVTGRHPGQVTSSPYGHIDKHIGLVSTLVSSSSDLNMSGHIRSKLAFDMRLTPPLAIGPMTTYAVVAHASFPFEKPSA